MSEAEFIELIEMGFNDAAFHAMNYVSILFAFLIMAYLVGRRLSKFQVWSVSILYSIFIILPAFGTIRTFALATKLIGSFHVEYPEPASNYFPFYSVADLFTLLISIVLAAAWVLSIIFLLNSRFTDDRDEAT